MRVANERCPACHGFFTSEAELDKHLEICPVLYELKAGGLVRSLVRTMPADEYEAMERRDFGRHCGFGINVSVCLRWEKDYSDYLSDFWRHYRAD